MSNMTSAQPQHADADGGPPQLPSDFRAVAEPFRQNKMMRSAAPHPVLSKSVQQQL